MRNTFMVLTLVISVLLPSKALATGIDFQVKNVTVREAVLKLQQQYGFSVTVESNEVDMNRKVSVSAKNESISTILQPYIYGAKCHLYGNQQKYCHPKPETTYREYTCDTKATPDYRESDKRCR